MLLGVIIVAHWLLAHKAEVHLLLDHLRLISWHELLSVLVWVCELAAPLVVEVLLGAAITVRGRLPERRVRIGPLTEIFVLQTFS